MTTQANAGAFAPNSNPSKESTLKNKEQALVKFGLDPSKIILEDGRYWMTAEEVGKALGYKDPKQSIFNLYQRNKDELQPYKGIIKMVYPSASDGRGGGVQETLVFNTDGMWLAAILAKTHKAKKFRKFIVNMLKALERQEFIHISQIDRYCTKEWIHMSEIEQWGRKIKQMKQDLTDIEISFYVFKSPQINYRQYNNLVRYRNMGLSQREIAKLLDISRAVVRKIERISRKYEGYDYPGKFRPILIKPDLDELLANKKPALRNLKGILKGGAS